ncbi:MAG: fibrinogen-like YCDxxxxGGGW domain-containing protein, partial [Odoribacter sp.]
LGGADGMMADDTDTWSGQTGEEYPNGYKGFYVMKYEVSQEQYVEFLNKLTYVQQKARSIGDALDALPLKAYLFGTTPTAPSQRNGIVLITREAGLPLTFACNLNTADGGHSLGGDGQAVACNFLSIADMLAYADWCGLRPLTEMEYEKMSRRPYPQKPERGEYAWGSKDGLVFPAGLQNEGRKDEKMQAGNVNIGQIVPGPVRCGIFAGGGTKQMAAGSSFWGVMDLCGNLAEMYYTVNTAGRGFRDYQGNGELPATGAADMSAYWPSNADAVGVRGGSYQSGTGETATSARGNATKYFKSLIERSSEVSFRLGRSVAGSNLSSILTAANGKNTEMGMAFDTICSGEDYRIQGNSDLQGATYYTYIWYSSENEGKTWERMGGEEGKDLCVRGLKNIGMEDRMLKKYWYKRKVITPQGDGESNAVAVSVVDDSYRIDRLKDTVTIFDETNGIRVWTKNKTTFEWTGMSTGAKIAPKQEDEKYSYLLPTRATFITAADKNLFGVKVVDLKMTIAATCTHNEAIELFFPDAVDTKVIGLLDHQDGYKLWSDGTFAASADEYRHPKPPYRYTGKTGSGVYRIDPDGPGSMAPFNVYCDMETDGGGWMLAGKFTNSDARYWSADKNSWTDQTSRGSFTNITATADAKTPVWGGCPVKYMMFQNMGNTQKAFKTTTLLKDTGPVTLSSFFTEMLADFPNPSGSAYMKTLNISFLTSAYNDFPWINQSGFRAGQIVIGKSSGSRSQGVISGTMANGIYDVCGLGALGYHSYTAPVFENGSYRADVGWGSEGASAERNVL